ncbi:MAG: 3-deoxy-D-manno-octulosonic acid transferase [Bacteroidetes bacterium]|nr:MAG: 3-deoxy-D-manno-octulosonic acid transferase [Bacteroidota bacterium]REK05287.1 MAG: 3-deoxy-D-manno-octulosonic acid transferase [Bacteroidota bacterium]REK32692.1 MAG: 3-deoxy-D-manno-octulosonic acid transferase [Bacteroidota bacterium]REK48861.1 MAG: 3-deoxy-D-manno-octulosonic acid transferase [Bacteroidota bacterium]
MRILYSISIYLYTVGVRLFAIFGNHKAELWIKGRKNWRSKYSEILKNDNRPSIWFHCASLGEFEQGRPVIEEIRKRNPYAKIILTFFSPSGYEIRKNYPVTDHVFYLPPDLTANAKYFVSLLNPKAVLFIKYDFWFNYLNELNVRKIPVYFISSGFRKNQIFFSPAGKYFLNILRNVNHYFLQNKTSGEILSAHNILNYTVSGDTRYDRVKSNSLSAICPQEIKNFANEKLLIVCGSTWPADEDIIFKILDSELKKRIKLVFAPHEVHAANIIRLKNKSDNLLGIGSTALFSESIGKNTQDSAVLIIDCIGILGSAYKCAHIAYVGGGMKNALHNILEPAAFGKPVLMGNNHSKYPEAKALEIAGGAFSFGDSGELKKHLIRLIDDKILYTKAENSAKMFVSRNCGATNSIIDKLISDKII